MFEQEYSRANDRIHPRKDLLQEMEAKWAQEEAQLAAKQAKAVAFPRWARYGAMAAGILLCVGVGMGSVMLYTRSRGLDTKSASAESPMQMESKVAEEEPKILTATLTAEQEAASAPEATEEEATGGPLEMQAKVAEKAYEPPTGMHPAMDEAEVENAVRYGELERAAATAEAPNMDVSTDTETGGEIPEAEVPAAANQIPADAAPESILYDGGAVLQRNDLMTVFLPTTQQVHVVQYDNRKMTSVFSLTLREYDAQVKRLFWMGGEFLAVRERGDGTEVLRFDVGDWAAPKHLKNLTQSGAFLGAGEVAGRLMVLSLYRATEEEPRPWVNGARMDYDDVLLDSERPCDTFTVITVYDPVQGETVSQLALLAESRGVAFGPTGLLLWTEAEEPALYAFSLGAEGLTLAAEETRQGTVLSAASADEGFSLLLQNGANTTWVTLDAALQETAASATKNADPVRWAQAYEDGAAFLTDNAFHWLDAADRALEVTGDVFWRLSDHRGVVLAADGKLHLVAMEETGLASLADLEVKEDLALLVADPSRLAYDQDTGRLVFPAGQHVYQFRIDETGANAPQSKHIDFNDQKGEALQELRCLLLEDRALIFYRQGVVLCTGNLVKQSTFKY